MPEIVVFDIDGVLIDTNLSFRVAVSRTIQYYMTKVLNYEDNGLLILPEEVQLFKLAGGYNDDWVLSQSAIMFFFYKALVSGYKDTYHIRLVPPSLEEFTKSISYYDEGIRKVRDYIEKRDRLILPKIEGFVRSDLVISIFQEMYAGKKYLKRLYGRDPEIGIEEGVCEKEEIILDKNLLVRDIYYGIYTGRTDKETELALERLDIQIPKEVTITADSGIKKPDPRGLEIIRSFYEKESLAFIGDSMDDVLSAKNADAIPVAICIDDYSKEIFKRYTDLIFPNVNEYLRHLSCVLS
jgi:HAD superfamily hydrolase (TIGR01548 family)